MSSQFQPNKFGNATEIVGALKQDRHSGIMGELGAARRMIPVSVKVRTYTDGNTVRKEKDLNFNVFVHQKWTPYLMMVTLFNSISGMNDFAEEATYRLTGEIELDGQPNVSLSTMLAPSEMPMPAPMLLAGWWGDKFNRLFGNAVKLPKLKRVNATVDLLPERRIATIETGLATDDRSSGRHRGSGQGFPSAISRRANRARGHGENSCRYAEGRAPHSAQRCRNTEPDAERRRNGKPLHRSCRKPCR